MRLLTMILLLMFALGVLAVPLEATPSQDSALEIPTITNFDDDFAPVNGTVDNNAGGSRATCGKYKFDDGWVQDFPSQVWAGRPRDQQICHLFNYDFTNAKKKNTPGKMVAAKVDLGCTCFFYSVACEPTRGHSEAWLGWDGWNNWAYTDKSFKGWWCYEAY